MFFRLSKGFKINAPFMEDNTPIHNVDLEEGVLGKANKNGTMMSLYTGKEKNIQEKKCKKVIKTYHGNLKHIHKLIHLKNIDYGV